MVSKILIKSASLAAGVSLLWSTYILSGYKIDDNESSIVSKSKKVVQNNVSVVQKERDDNKFDSLFSDFEKMYAHLYDSKKPDLDLTKKHDVVVIIMDMQRECLIEQDIQELKREIPNYVSVLYFAKNNNIPVIEVNYGGVNTSQTIGVLKNIINSLPIKNNIVKYADDAFEDTSLENVLKKYGAKYVLLAGVHESMCMYETGKSAHNLGFKLLLSHDLMSNPKIVNHAHSAEDPYYLGDAEQYREMFKNYSVSNLSYGGGIITDNYRDLLNLIKLSR